VADPDMLGHQTYTRSPYDDEFFSSESGAQDREHCDECGSNISSMTLCRVRESGPSILLCAICRERLFRKESSNNHRLEAIDAEIRANAPS